jgi:hypothetical protein
VSHFSLESTPDFGRAGIDTLWPRRIGMRAELPLFGSVTHTSACFRVLCALANSAEYRPFVSIFNQWFISLNRRSTQSLPGLFDAEGWSMSTCH